jgi:hypothetical protein
MPLAGRALLGMSTLLPAAATLAMTVGRAPHRMPVLIAFGLALLGSCAVEVWADPDHGSNTASDKASRWLFSLVLCVCLASEVGA